MPDQASATSTVANRGVRGARRNALEHEPLLVRTADVPRAGRNAHNDPTRVTDPIGVAFWACWPGATSATLPENCRGQRAAPDSRGSLASTATDTPSREPSESLARRALP